MDTDNATRGNGQPAGAGVNGPRVATPDGWGLGVLVAVLVVVCALVVGMSPEGAANIGAAITFASSVIAFATSFIGFMTLLVGFFKGARAARAESLDLSEPATVQSIGLLAGGTGLLLLGHVI